MKDITVIMTIGLPGAGKTYHIEGLSERLHRKHNVAVITEDTMYKTLEEELKRSLIRDTNNGKKYANYLLIDIFVPSKKVLEKYKKIIDRELELQGFNPIYELHIFRPNPKYSYINDYYRSREEKSAGTIARMAQNWEFDPQSMIDVFGNVVIEHLETYEPSTAMKTIAEKELFDANVKRKIKSRAWTIEGWGKGVDEEFYMFEEDEKPTTFVELDTVMEILIGEDLYEEIKDEIYDNFVDEVTYDEDDEYETYVASYYEADLDKIIDYLKEYDLYKEES